VSPRAIRLLVIASVMGVFLGGLTVGYVLGVRRAAEPAPAPAPFGPRPPHPPGPPGPPGPRVDRLLEEFAGRLALTPEQRDRIRTILADGARAAHEITLRVRPELEAERAEIEAAIADVLTEEQRARYREMLPEGLSRPPGPPP
jgi:Spy/CpxP family protein refolding chaperone